MTNKYKEMSEFLNDWVFHFNPYKELWYAFKREDYIEFFNGKHEVALKGPKINDIIEYLILTKGNSE